MKLNKRHRKRIDHAELFMLYDHRYAAFFTRRNAYGRVTSNRYESPSLASRKRLLRLLMERYPEAHLTADWRAK